MTRGKKIRDKGKIKLSRYFKKIKVGDIVSIVPELGVRAAFPKRLKGRSGRVIDERGSFKMVEIKDGKLVKKFLIHPVHLKVIQNGNK
ncbi:50S ribosomal protein L21e [Candidatus Pacearchaeota archaeon]|nr:MAG: 50S ribosomal protein L21e [Candidatus Pacearchaeota archaeon]